jgi:hypothetical protein
MGGTQSTSSNGTPGDFPTEGDNEHNTIRPYGMAPNSQHIELNSSHRSLYDGMISLVKENKYADILVICGDDRYPVHRAIVCPRSTFFEEKCMPDRGEPDYASPSKPTRIWIERWECESHIVAAVLAFLYTMDYNPSGPQALTFGKPKCEENDMTMRNGGRASTGNSRNIEANTSAHEVDESMATMSVGNPTPSGTWTSHTTGNLHGPDEVPNELVFHVHMCAAGQYFGIESLSDVAEERLTERLSTGPWTTEMVECIRAVYRKGTTGKLAAMREAVVESAMSRFRILKTSEGWDDLVGEFPEFAAEIYVSPRSMLGSRLLRMSFADYVNQTLGSDGCKVSLTGFGCSRGVSGLIRCQWQSCVRLQSLDRLRLRWQPLHIEHRGL